MRTNSPEIQRQKQRRSPFEGSRRTRARHGATLVETAIVLGAVLILLLGMLDLALVEVQNNTLSEGARRLAAQRPRTVALASPQSTCWGSAVVQTNAGDGSQYAEVVTPILGTIVPADVSLGIQWLDGGNQLGQRVQVTLSMQHHSIIPINLYGSSCNLQAVSTMLIQH